MTAREAVLCAVRAALGRPQPDAAAIAAAAQALLADPDAIRPALSCPDLADAFAAAVTSSKVGATLDRIGWLSALPVATARYLAGHGLGRELALQPDPELRALDWSAFTLIDALRPDEAAGLGVAKWGIAETGSLVFHSGPDTAVLAHFLPLHHIAVLRTRCILPHLEDYAARAGVPPRNLNLITGASGTTDIEGSYVRGAHGPRFLHVILVNERTSSEG